MLPQSESKFIARLWMWCLNDAYFMMFNIKRAGGRFI